MYNGKTFLAIIPARGGSKRLSRKNILPLLGKPLIGWTIEQAKKSKYLDRIIVSTEDEEISEVSKSFGAEVLKRPEDLAQDDTPTSDVIIHVIENLEKEGFKYDFIVLLEPTSPLRKDDDIDNAIEVISNNSYAYSLVSLGEIHLEHPEYVKILGDDGFIYPYCENNIKYHRRQDLPKAYFPYGVVYICKTEIFKEKRTFYMEKTIPYIIDRWQNYEIDDIYDLLCIENIFKYILEVTK
jgi:CMP-N,N'-diacetyllegionaminic acid synthase